jgi:hypothetical protein
MPAAPTVLTVHRLRAGRLFAWMWLVVAALSLVDILRRGAAGEYYRLILALLAGCLVAYVFGLRPAVLEGVVGIEVRNPLRTTDVPWPAFTGADAKDVLLLRTKGGEVRCFAVPVRGRPQRPPGTVTGGLAGGLGAAMRLPGITPPMNEGRPPAGAAAVAERLEDLAPDLRKGAPPGQVTTHYAPDGAGALALAVVLLVVAVL